MKNFILAALTVGGLTCAMNPSASAQTRDTVIVTTKTKKVITITERDSTSTKEHKSVSINFGTHRKKRLSASQRDSLERADAAKGRFIGGITFTRVDLGFSKLIDNGSFSLAPENEFLDYKASKTSTVSFDVLQFGYRFTPHFKIYVAGGFDWTLIRLKKDITIQQDTRELSYVEDDVNYSKNRFSNSYVHIPLNFEFRSKENDKGKRFYFIAGPEVSFLLNGKVKQVSDEHGKVKYKDDYNFQPFRYGGTVRLGYGGLGIFTKYYFNDMFDSPAQKGLRNMSFGVTFGLN